MRDIFSVPPARRPVRRGTSLALVLAAVCVASGAEASELGGVTLTGAGRRPA